MPYVSIAFTLNPDSSVQAVSEIRKAVESMGLEFVEEQSTTRGQIFGIVKAETTSAAMQAGYDIQMVVNGASPGLVVDVAPLPMVIGHYVTATGAIPIDEWFDSKRNPRKGG